MGMSRWANAHLSVVREGQGAVELFQHEGS